MRALDEYAETEWSKKGFPPSLEELRARARPTAADLGIPDRESAFQDLYWMRWNRHPVIWSIAQAIREDHPQAFKYPEGRLRALFAPEYDRHLERAKQGEHFQAPDTNGNRLEFDKPVKVTGRTDARTYLAAMRSRIAGIEPGSDPEPEPEPFQSDARRREQMESELSAILQDKGPDEKPEPEPVQTGVAG